jgi:hypothetical protein
MPNIKPYPHQDNTYDMSYHHRHNQPQQQQHYSVYRPAYHRIPSTPAIAPLKEVWASTMSPEVSPIVVPSMSAASVDFYQSAVASNFGYQQQQYYRQPIVQSNSNVSKFFRYIYGNFIYLFHYFYLYVRQNSTINITTTLLKLYLLITVCMFLFIIL